MKRRRRLCRASVLLRRTEASVFVGEHVQSTYGKLGEEHVLLSRPTASEVQVHAILYLHLLGLSSISDVRRSNEKGSRRGWSIWLATCTAKAPALGLDICCPPPLPRHYRL